MHPYTQQPTPINQENDEQIALCVAVVGAISSLDVEMVDNGEHLQGLLA